MGSKGNKTKKAQAKKQHKALLRRRKQKEALRARNIRRNLSKPTKADQGASMDEAMAKVMEEFSASGEMLWWVANGINCFQSDYDEGVWSPVFPEIYDDQLAISNEAVKDWLAQHFNEEDKSWTDEGRYAAGLVMSPVPVIFVIADQCKKAAKEAEEEGGPEIDPHSVACDPVWKVFDKMKKEIIARDKKNAEEAAKAAKAAEEAVDDTPADTDAVSDEVVETPAKTAENEEATTEAVES